MKKNVRVLGFFLVWVVTPAFGLPPTCPKPTLIVTAQSVYSTPPNIIVKWKDQPSETSYEIWRTVNTGTPTKVKTTVANVTTWTDTSVNNTDNFTYDVQACTGATCASIGTFSTSVKVVFPVPAGEVLHGFNEVLAWAGISGSTGAATGYHDGVDINKSTTEPAAGDDLLAPRGGVIADILDNGTTNDNSFIAVRIDLGGGNVEYDTFNHIANKPGTDRVVCMGEVVATGQKIAQVGTGFPGNFSDHVHSMVTTGATRGVNSDRHFLTIFTNNSDRDPGSTNPAFYDENNDNKNVLFRDHNEAVKTKYLDYDHTKPFPLRLKPLSGDIDIHAEITDQQGTNPRQAPMKLNYWIEGPIDNSVDFDDVMKVSKPYKFYDFQNTYLGAGTPVNCELISDIQDTANSGCKGLTNCTSIPGGSCSSVIKEGTTDYPWPVLHHYIVTHAKDGVTPAVDANMYWRTKAKEDGAGEALLHANYAGKTQATKGSEARFPDGEYTLHFLASDLVHSNVDLQFKNVRLENYAPFIKEMTIYLDRDNSIGTQANADYPGCELKIYEFKHNNPDSYPGANFAAAKTGEFIGADQKICIKIRFSEGMDSAWADFKVSLDPGGVGAGASPIAFAGSFSKTYTEDDTWKGSATMPADASGGSDSSNSVITVKARDLPDRSSNQRGLDKNDDGVGEADFTDDIHKVPTDARPPEPSLTKTP